MKKQLKENLEIEITIFNIVYCKLFKKVWIVRNKLYDNTMIYTHRCDNNAGFVYLCNLGKSYIDNVENWLSHNFCCWKDDLLIYWPGPDKDLSMNFFLAKHNHHLDGRPSSVLNTFSQTRLPHSCLSWVK